MPLSIENWILAISPVVVLLVGILLLKWKTSRVGSIALLIAVITAYCIFGADVRLVAFANCKGLSLSLYVLLIIWGAIFLFNIADKAGAINVIGQTIRNISNDRLIQCLLLAWCFTSLLQGLAGFGVPVAIVAPIMVAIGFEPLTAVATCLIGHSWAISFGSMGSSYNSIQLVTKIPGEIIGPCMALSFAIPILATGLEVAHIYEGKKGLKKSILPIVSAATTMSLLLWLMNFIGTPQLASLMAAAGGCAIIAIWAYLHRKTKKEIQPKGFFQGNMSFYIASAPYLALIFMSVVTQIPVVKTCLSGYYWGLDYPQTQTALGYIVEGTIGYSKIKFFSHPAPILFLSAFLGYFVYSRYVTSMNPHELFKYAIIKTTQKCIPTSVGISTMVMMALVMSDSGMTNLIAKGVASAFGNYYPLASPFIGNLGTFITGSNTNSNIMFGALQYETAILLGKNAVLMAAAQSVGGSLGVAMAPSTIMMGAANVGMTGKESLILSKTIRYCMLNLIFVGLIVWFLA